MLVSRIIRNVSDYMICNTLRKNNKVKTEFDGFTIVELLVVIVVIAILAAITIVGYRNVSGNARKSALTSDLNQANKALNVYKETSSTEKFPSSLSAAGLTLSSNITYSYTVSADRSNYCLQGTTDGVTKSIAGNNQTVSDATCVSATNLITNGDFSNGTSGWSMVRLSYTNSPLIITATSDNAEHYIQYTIPPSVGHKYYFQSHLKPSTGTRIWIYNLKSDYTYEGTASSISYSEASLFTSFTTTSTYSSPTMIFRISITNSAGNAVFSGAGESVKPSYAIAVDLTDIFGSGNEPTAAEMDAILTNFPNSWFNGTNVIQVPTE